MSRVYRNPLKGRKYKAEVSVGSGSTRKRKSKTFNDMTEARIWIHQMEIMADRGTDFEKSRWLFIDYYWQWVQLYKKPVVSANTMHTYWTSYQHFSQGLGDVRLEDLTRNRIQKYLNGLDLSHESIRKDLMQLRSCLRDAVSDGVLTHNPAAGTLRIVANPSRTKGDDQKFMSIHDFKRVRNFLLSYHYRINDVDRLALLIISQSGLRVGECLALKYEDIDCLHNTITVDESWDSKHNILKEPKTKHARRTIPLPEQVVHILEKWMSYQRRYVFREGVANPDQFILMNKRGRLPRAGSINAAYHQIQIKLGMEPKFSTQTFRHTLASLMVADENISMVYVSRYLGHASVMITEKYYIGLLPEQVEVEAGKVLKVIEG